MREARQDFKKVLDEAKAGEAVVITRNSEEYTLMQREKASAVQHVLERLKDLERRMGNVEHKSTPTQNEQQVVPGSWGA